MRSAQRDSTEGPSPSYGTRSVPTAEITCRERRNAVRLVCSLAHDRGVTEIVALLDILGLDPSEGRTCQLHGEECYGTETSSPKDEESHDDR